MNDAADAAAKARILAEALPYIRRFHGKTRRLDVQAEVRPLELSYRHYQGHEVYDHR